MRQLILLSLISLIALGCGKASPTAPKKSTASCEKPAPLIAPETCAYPNAFVDEFVVKLIDGIDYKAEALRLGQKYGFSPEFWSLVPNFFGASLSREALLGMRCEPTIAEFRCARTNIPPPSLRRTPSE